MSKTYPRGPVYRPFHLLRPNCAAPRDLNFKIFLLCVITLSTLSLLFLLSRLLRARYATHGTIFLWRRWRRKRGGEEGRERETGYFTVADLFGHLMVLLCMYEICYSICDYVYVLDCYTPVGNSIGGLPAQDMLSQNNYVLGAAREFFAAQTLFLHGSIAYCMHAYMVRKVTALQLYRKPRVILMTLGSVIYLAVRASLAFGLRSELFGFRVGRLVLTDLLLIPLCLSCITWWYLGVMRILRNPAPTVAAAAAAAATATAATTSQTATRLTPRAAAATSPISTTMGEERGGVDGGRQTSQEGEGHAGQASCGGGDGVMMLAPGENGLHEAGKDGQEEGEGHSVRQECSLAVQPLMTANSSAIRSAPSSFCVSVSASSSFSSPSSSPKHPPIRGPSRRFSTSSVGSSRGRSIQPALNRQLLKRLTFILYVIVGVWLMVIAMDLIVWIRYLLDLPPRAAPLLIRSTILCSLGLMDALILGLDLPNGCCCSSSSSSFSSWICPWLGWFVNRRNGKEEEEEDEEEGLEEDGVGVKEDDLEGGVGARQGRREGGRGGGGLGAGALARPMIVRMNSHPTLNFLSTQPREKGVTFSPSPHPLPTSSSPEEEALAIVAAAEEAVLARQQQQQQKQQQRQSLNPNASSVSINSNAPPPPSFSSTTKNLRLLVATYNMGGVNLDDPATFLSLQASLPRFLPPGLDLYAIGVQECTCFPTLRLLLHRYLGGPSAYALFHDKIGDAVVLHGFVGLVIFVKAADVAAGAFSLHHSTRTRLATGKEVMGGWLRIPNKGVVGLSARYFDTTVAFVTAHFASDKRGKNMLMRRNRDARMMLRRLGLVWGGDGVAVDVHHLHHQTFFCGDANYRCLTSPRDVLTRVALSARLSQARLLLPPSLPSPSMQGLGKWGDSSCGNRSLKPLNWREIQYERLLQGGKDGGMEEWEGKGEGGALTPLYPPYCLSSVPLNELPASLIKARREGGKEEGKEGVLGATLRRLFRSSRALDSSSGGGGIRRTMRRDSSSSSRSSRSSSYENGHNSISASDSCPTRGEMQGAGDGTGDRKPDEEEGGAGNGRQQLGQAVNRYACQSGEVGSNTELNIPVPSTSQIPSPSPFISSASSSTSLPASADFLPLANPSNPSAITSFPTLSTSFSLASSFSSSSSSPWAWVRTLDELHLSRQQRLVFWGWREGMITFPPSYRWHRQTKSKEGGKEGGLAGDFTSVEQLVARAYTTRTTAKAPAALLVAPTPCALPPDNFSQSSLSRMRLSNTPAAAAAAPPLLLPSSSTLDGDPRPGDDAEEGEADLCLDEEEDEEEEEEEEEDELKKDARVIRTPSYTDRVLSHSMPGQGQLLQLLHYDMNDEIELSDHRPVVATYALTVDGSVKGFRSTSLSGKEIGVDEDEVEEKDEGEDLAVFTFTFRRPQVELFVPPRVGEEEEGGKGERSIKAGGGGGVTSSVLPTPHSVIFLFPLVPEDPVAEERLALALGEALPSVPFLAPSRGASLSSSPFSNLRQRGRSGSNDRGDGIGDIDSSSKHGRSASWGRSRNLTASARRDVRWGAKGFPVRFETVASLKFSQHMLIRLSDAKGWDLGECVVPVSVALFDDQAEEDRGLGRGIRKEQSRAMRLPLTKGGQFHGWLCFEMRVTTSPL